MDKKLKKVSQVTRVYYNAPQVEISYVNDTHEKYVLEI